jgi:ubiquinone/menaquinone biosynthesis C-methylase UbiE
MGRLLDVMSPYHKKTAREYLPRMNDNKIEAMQVARQYEFDYWDGDRRYGYGGYSYRADYWKPVAERFIQEYDLPPGARVLDVGCGKAYILYELHLLRPDIEIHGFDISKHGISDAPAAIRDRLFNYHAEKPYPYGDNYFDLVFSMATLHNLRLYDLKTALQEIMRVGKQQFVMLESYRNEAELFNLQCWALTAESFFSTEEWIWLYQHFGYTGDYEFIYFE